MHSEEWDDVEDRLDLVSTKQLDYFIEEFSSCFIAPVLQTGQSAAYVIVEPTNLHDGGEESKLWLDETVVFLNGGELEKGDGSAQAQLGSCGGPTSNPLISLCKSKLSITYACRLSGDTSKLPSFSKMLNNIFATGWATIMAPSVSELTIHRFVSNLSTNNLLPISGSSWSSSHHKSSSSSSALSTSMLSSPFRAEGATSTSCSRNLTTTSECSSNVSGAKRESSLSAARWPRRVCPSASCSPFAILCEEFKFLS